MLPFSYALRNLWRLRARTAITVVGVALITVLVILMSGFARGLAETARKTASPETVIVTGTSGEHDLVRSVLSLEAARAVSINLPEVAETDGRRAVSVELHVATRKGHAIGLLRGVETGARRHRGSF